KLALFPDAHALERLGRVCLVDVDDGVELVAEPGPEVVRETLRLRPVDDADRPLEPRFLQPARVEQKARLAPLVEAFLPASGQGGTDVLALGRAAPVGGGGDGAGVGGEADEEAVVTVALAAEL